MCTIAFLRTFFLRGHIYQAFSYTKEIPSDAVFFIQMTTIGVKAGLEDDILLFPLIPAASPCNKYDVFYFFNETPDELGPVAHHKVWISFMTARPKLSMLSTMLRDDNIRHIHTLTPVIVDKIANNASKVISVQDRTYLK